jgi:hypothetical protein
VFKIIDIWFVKGNYFIFAGWPVSAWHMDIYLKKFIIKNVFSPLQPSNRLLTYLFKCLLCHYMLDVATISSVCFWCQWQARNNMVKHAFLSPSAQLNNCTLISLLLEGFYENISFSKPHKRSKKDSNQGWEVSKFAAIVTVQIAVWLYVRAKYNVKGVQHDIGSLQHCSTLHKPLCWQT